MTLERDNAEPGLWRDPDAPAGSPGVHALIVGISRYPHLAGGDGRLSADNAGMGQLVVSASAAAQVFDWLRTHGRFIDRPVVSCRLLLAPGVDARQAPTEAAFVDAITGGWHGEADFESVRRGVLGWAKEFVRTPLEQRPQNGAFFFFSGHGLEVLASPSLLAGDVLDPDAPGGGGSNAIAYKNILDVLPTYGFGDGMFLFDACRNAPDAARRMNIVGQSVLAPAPYAADPPQSAMFLKATAANYRSYQDPSSPRRASMFGQALLEAFEGVEPDWRPYDCGATPWALRFGALEAYAKQRVRELLAEKDTLKVQTVIPGGEPYDSELCVAVRQPPPPVPLAGLPPDDRAQAADDLEALAAPMAEAPLEDDAEPAFEADVFAAPPARAAGAAGDEWDIVHAPADAPVSAAEAVEQESARVLDRFDIKGPGAAGGQDGAAMLRDFGRMHSVFGGEDMTLPFTDMLRIADLQGAPADPQALRVLGGQTSRQDGLSWIDLEVTTAPELGDALWLAFDSERWPGASEDRPESFALLLPRDRNVPTPVRLEVDWSRSPSGLFRPDRISARIGPPSPTSAWVWDALWQAQRTEALRSLKESAEVLLHVDAAAEDALRNKIASPLAAAFGAARLLDAGTLEPLRDWPRNLANYFPTLAEGPVLWAETCLRRARAAGASPGPSAAAGPRDGLAAWWAREEVKEAAAWFAKVAGIGLPLLGPTLRIAAGQAQLWQAGLDGAPAPLRDGLSTACTLVLQAASIVADDEAFIGFRSSQGRLEPDPAYRRLARPERHAELALA